MTNSMSNVKELIKTIEQNFKLLQKEILDQYQVSFIVEKKDILSLLTNLKALGWIQMSYLSAIDWPNKNKFEIVYILFNWENPIYIQIRAMVDRKKPELPSIIRIFPGAKYYERECHESFGIKFPGNPDYHKQLILENWDDMPPMRKDFDPKAYSDRKFTQRKYSQDYIVKGKGLTTLLKKQQREKRAKQLLGGKK